MRQRGVYIIGGRDWRFLWLKRKRKLIAKGNYRVYTDPRDKEKRWR